MVHQVEVRSELRGLSTLRRIDYADSFTADIAAAPERTGEEWARAVLEGAPGRTRALLRSVWTAIGIRLGPDGSDRFVLGLEVVEKTSEHALLAATSALGARAELLFKPEEDALVFATFVQFENILGRALWLTIRPAHLRAVRHVLVEACRRDAAAVPVAG